MPIKFLLTNKQSNAISQMHNTCLAKRRAFSLRSDFSKAETFLAHKSAVYRFGLTLSPLFAELSLIEII